MTGAVLPEAAQRFIDATNAEDRDRLVAAFTTNAVVDDFGRTFVGPRRIQEWSDQEHIGTKNRITLSQVIDNGDLSLALEPPWVR